MRPQAEQRYLEAMALVEVISAGLCTSAYVWGGWTLDIYRGQVLRKHSDVDCFVVDLHQLFARFSERMHLDGWRLRDPLAGHLLWAERDGVKLHLGHIEIDGGIVNWKHNGRDGSILFPADWLRQDVVGFRSIDVHVVEPELGYVLKTNPRLMNPDWVPRSKDRADIATLRTVLLEKQVDLDALPPQVLSV